MRLGLRLKISISAWLAPTFGIGEMCYVFYMKHIFLNRRCSLCYNLPKIVVYRVGPLARCEGIGGKAAESFCKEKNIKLPGYENENQSREA